MKIRLHSNIVKNGIAIRWFYFSAAVLTLINGQSLSFANPLYHLNSNIMILWCVLFVLWTSFEIVNLWFGKKHFIGDLIGIEYPTEHGKNFIYGFSFPGKVNLLNRIEGPEIILMTSQNRRTIRIIGESRKICRTRIFHS